MAWLLIYVVLLTYGVKATGNYCHEANGFALTFCQGGSISAVTVYIDSSGVPVGDAGECICHFDSDNINTDVRLKFIVIEHPDAGNYSLTVNGRCISETLEAELTQGTFIKFIQHTTKRSLVCIKITTEVAGANPVNVKLTCEPRPLRTPISSHDACNDKSVEAAGENESNSSKLGVIIGAAVGGVVVVAVVVIAFYLLYKRRGNAANTTSNNNVKTNIAGKDPEYDMTVNEGYDSVDRNGQKTDANFQAYEYVGKGNDFANSKPKLTSHSDGDLKHVKHFPNENATTALDSVQYSVVHKPYKRREYVQTNDDNEYNHLNEVTVNHTTENVYGTATAVEARNDDEDKYDHLTDKR